MEEGEEKEPGFDQVFPLRKSGALGVDARVRLEVSFGGILVFSRPLANDLEDGRLRCEHATYFGGDHFNRRWLVIEGGGTQACRIDSIG